MVWQDGWVKTTPRQLRVSRRHRTLQEKAEILQAQQGSGLSLLAFAGKHGLCYTSLLRWKRRQRNQDSSGVPPALEAGPGFVPVKLEGEGLGGDYVLSWTGGRSLKIPRHFQTDSLRRLLSVLEGLE